METVQGITVGTSESMRNLEGHPPLIKTCKMAVKPHIACTECVIRKVDDLQKKNSKEGALSPVDTVGYKESAPFTAWKAVEMMSDAAQLLEQFSFGLPIPKG